MDFSDNYLLTLGTFLPMVGVLVMLFIPGTQRAPQGDRDPRQAPRSRSASGR
jgi:hypothetical protein